MHDYLRDMQDPTINLNFTKKRSYKIYPNFQHTCFPNALLSFRGFTNRTSMNGYLPLTQSNEHNRRIQIVGFQNNSHINGFVTSSYNNMVLSLHGAA
jgi:hypothetical protein